MFARLWAKEKVKIITYSKPKQPIPLLLYLLNTHIEVNVPINLVIKKKFNSVSVFIITILMM